MPRARPPGLRRPLAAGLILAALLSGSPSNGRPATVEDLLRREAFGAVAADPTGRWLVIEHQRPYQESFRFDLDVFNDYARTRLDRVDLRHPGPARPLFRADAKAGYVAGPFSPDGRRLAVYRLTATDWELGVATLATGAVRWMHITPEWTQDSKTLAWVTPTRLVVIARPPRDLPYDLRHRPTAPTLLPDRWRRAAAGQAEVTVVGGGDRAGIRPAAAPRRLVEIDLGGRPPRTLATGAFVALEVAPGARRIALVEALGDTPMAAGRPVQSDYGVENLAHRAQVLELPTGRLTTLAANREVLLHPLAWSPNGRELLIYARSPQTAWTQGALLRADAVTGAVRSVGVGIRPRMDLRPEAVRAGWLGDDPLVWGVKDGPSPAAPGWWRLLPAGDLEVTAGLAGLRRDGLTVTGGTMLVSGSDALWRIGPDGARTAMATGAAAAAYSQVGRNFHHAYDVPSEARLIGVRRAVEGDHILAVSPHDVRDLATLAPGAELLAAPGAGGGVLARVQPSGGEERLVWLRAGGAPVEIATINQGLADLDAPDIRPVTHPGPAGQPLTSWLLLPKGRPLGTSPPPLVVWPYPGSTLARAPSTMDFRKPGFDKYPALLAAHGYAVLLPSLPGRTDGGDPAAGLADRVLAIVDAAAADPALKDAFDPTRLGVWGLSYGGYGTLAMITQTGRFRAAIAQASPSDLISMWGQFQPAMAADPSEGVSSFYSAGWIEDLQGDMRAPPWADPGRYVRNTPLLRAGAITTPLLLLHGDQDSIPLAQSQEMFTALWRQGKTVELATYWGEGHGISSPGDLRDLLGRAFGWLDSYLGGDGPTATGATPRPHPGSASANAAPRLRSPRR